jgi:hypothetical protein
MKIGCEVVDVGDVVSKLVHILICDIRWRNVRLLLRSFCFLIVVLGNLSLRLNLLSFFLSNIVKYSILDRE